MREGIVPQCRNCLKHNTLICNVFVSPEFQWRNGKCFGYVDRPEDMEKMYREMLEYAYSKGYNSRETKAIADYWHNIVTGKEKCYAKEET